MPVCRFGATVSVRVEIDKELHRELKDEAAAQGCHLKDLIVAAIEEKTRGLRARPCR